MMPNFRPRISILTALLLMTIASMAIVMAQMGRQAAAMRRELKTLRTEVGVLTIDDDSKIHVVQVREPGAYRWNWRIWLPKGRDYWLCASQKAPPKGITKRQFSTFLGMGGQEINLRVQLVPNENGKRTIYMKGPAADCPLFEVEDARWVNGKTMIGDDVAGEKSQVSSKVDEPLVLLRLYEAPGVSQPPDGLLIWISDQQKP